MEEQPESPCVQPNIPPTLVLCCDRNFGRQSSSYVSHQCFIQLASPSPPACSRAFGIWLLHHLQKELPLAGWTDWCTLACQWFHPGDAPKKHIATDTTQHITPCLFGGAGKFAATLGCRGSGLLASVNIRCSSEKRTDAVTLHTQPIVSSTHLKFAKQRYSATRTPEDKKRSRSTTTRLK